MSPQRMYNSFSHVDIQKLPDRLMSVGINTG